MLPNNIHKKEDMLWVDTEELWEQEGVCWQLS